MKTVVLFTLLYPLLASAIPLSPRNGGDKCDTAPFSDPPQVSTPESTLYNLAGWGVYISLESPLCRDTPSGFTVDQVTILMRHGARGPTASSYPKVLSAVAKAGNATVMDPAFDFVKTYSADGFTADALTDYGRKQMYDAGSTYARRYKKLVNSYFARAASQERVVESGQYFMQGFLGDKFEIKNNTLLPALDLVIEETGEVNNTLVEVTCPGFDESTNLAAEAENNFNAIWMPAVTARLNEKLAGANFTDDDVRQLFTMCGYDGVKNLEYSVGPWCSVFTPAEFEQWEYLYDLSKYWGQGYGSPYRAAMYNGYVNEMIARFTGQPVVLGGSVNETLATNRATFPLDKTFYADFTQSDNDLVSIMVALGLWKDDPLPTKVSVDAIPSRFFHVSRILPFGARFVFERLTNKEGTKYVRVLINDAVAPLNFPECGAYSWAGLCELDAFVAAQSYAQEEPKHFNELCYGPPINTTVV